MGIGSLCIIKAYFDVFKVFGYSKGNNRPRRDDCFLIGNYLFVFAVIFPLSPRICQANITDFAKNEVSISFNNLCLNSVLELSAPFYREFSTADIISFIFSI